MLNQAVRYVVNGMWLREGEMAKQISGQQAMRKHGSEKFGVTKIPPAELQLFLLQSWLRMQFLPL